MNGPGVVLTLTLALLCGGARTDARGWSVVSPNAEVEAVQTAAGERGCRVEVKRGAGTVLWAADRCLGDRDDLHFVSNDGTGLIVIHAFPAKTADTPAGMKGAPGIEVFVKGERVAVHVVGKLVVDVRPLVNARKHFYWLEGTLGQPGVPPGFGKNAREIELTTLDRRSWSVGFDGTIRKIAMAKALGP